MTNEKELTHIDLFSGIGGFSLATEWAGFRTIVFCEKEGFCQKILQKRFGAIADTEGRKAQSTESGRFHSKSCGTNRKPALIPEIRDFDGTKYRGATLLTGGFPCQPFSVAGQRRGKEDDRYLWPEMLRVISEAKPHWILAENVPGIFRMALDTVLSDLEGEGYTTGTFIIPACGLNAPHRRNRVWIVANTRKQERNWLSNIGRQEMAEIGRENQDARNTGGKGLQGNSGKLERTEAIAPRSDSHAPDSLDNGYQGRYQEAGREVRKSEQRRMCKSPRESWEQNWYEIATRFCRVDARVSDRIHRLKALGNAIVPQIAYEILKNIAWIEKRVA